MHVCWKTMFVKVFRVYSIRDMFITKYLPQQWGLCGGSGWHRQTPSSGHARGQATAEPDCGGTWSPAAIERTSHLISDPLNIEGHSCIDAGKHSQGSLYFQGQFVIYNLSCCNHSQNLNFNITVKCIQVFQFSALTFLTNIEAKL